MFPRGQTTDVKSMASAAGLAIRKDPLAGFVWVMGPVPQTFTFREARDVWDVVQGLAMVALEESRGEGREAAARFGGELPRFEARQIAVIMGMDRTRLSLATRLFGEA